MIAVVLLAGALAGAGYIVAALMRRHDDEAERTALVSAWLRAKAFDDETIGAVLARFEDLALADIAEQRRRYLVEQGRRQEADAEHDRRSAAGHKAAATRARQCQPARSRRP